jgi:hypothetical protein
MSESDSTPLVALYKGRPASDLSHAELLSAYTHVCRLYTEMREWQVKADELEAFMDSVRRV